MPHPTGFPPLPAVAVVLLCAALMGALYQALFPRPARWPLVVLAVVLGGALTFLLTVLLSPTAQRLAEIDGLWSALKIVVLTVGLPEEAVKLLGALIALAAVHRISRRAATPAEGFQACLFAALGFAVVENSLYARAFSEVSILIAFGRGIVASFIHSTMAMIQGVFIARFVDPDGQGGGWRRWHLPLLAWLASAAAHAGFDWGMLQPLAKYFELQSSGDADPAAVEAAMAGIIFQNLPVLLIGIPAPFLIGLYLFRRALRTEGAADPRALDPDYAAKLVRWRSAGSLLLILGALGLIAATGAAIWLTASGALQPPPDAGVGPGAELKGGSLPVTIGVIVSPAAMVLGWLLRQKR